MPQHANAVSFLTVLFLCTGWSSYVIFIAQTLREIFPLKFSGMAHQKHNGHLKNICLEKYKKV